MENNVKYIYIHICCCSVTKSCLTLYSHGQQHTRLPCPSLSPRICSNSCPLSQWCYLTISSSATFFSFEKHQGLFKWVGSSITESICCTDEVKSVPKEPGPGSQLMDSQWDILEKMRLCACELWFGLHINLVPLGDSKCSLTPESVFASENENYHIHNTMGGLNHLWAQTQQTIKFSLELGYSSTQIKTSAIASRSQGWNELIL